MAWYSADNRLLDCFNTTKKVQEGVYWAKNDILSYSILHVSGILSDLAYIMAFYLASIMATYVASIAAWYRDTFREAQDLLLTAHIPFLEI